MLLIRKYTGIFTLLHPLMQLCTDNQKYIKLIIHLDPSYHPLVLTIIIFPNTCTKSLNRIDQINHFLLFEFVKRIMGIKDSANQIMVSFNVDNLYTNVPVHEAIEITLDMLFKNPNSPSIPFNRSQFKQLLEHAVCNVPFRFLDRKFVRIDGVAIGSPLGPILADLFMSNLEQKLNSLPTNL